MSKSEITVCRDCQIPLIWTFTWAYNEWFCINCGGHWGMLGAGDHVELTPELKRMNKVILRVWKAIAKNLIPRSQYGKDNCEKCGGKNIHRNHLSKQEIRKDKLASAMLKKMRGAWS